MKGALVALALMLAVCGCSKRKATEAKTLADDAAVVAPVQAKSSETLVLRQVLLETLDAPVARKIDSAALGRGLGKSLTTSGWIAARDADVPDDRVPRPAEAIVNLTYEVVEPTGKKVGSIVVAVDAELRFIDGGADAHPQAALMVEQPMKATGKEAINAALMVAAARALESLAESLVQRERLRRADTAELLSVMSTQPEDPGFLIWAMRLAAERTLVEAVPLVIRALDADDSDVRDAAIATLVSLGDERAVEALSKDVNFKDYVQLGVIMEAVTAIGGQDAIDFLEFVATGHPSDEMQERAQESIERIKKEGRNR